MSASPQHEMVHKGTDPSGAEEWLCEECGRHFIVRWRPTYDRVVTLHPGDASATHIGRMGDAAVRDLQVTRADVPAATPAEDAWRRWLRDNGMDWDGG
jgi:hypothetical protein